MKKLILIGLFYIIFINSYAQILKEFSSKPEEYIIQLKELIEAKDKKTGKEIFEELLPLWNSGYYNNNDKNNIISVSNELLNKRALPIPHFESFSRTLLAFSKQNIAKNDFEEWLKGLSYLCRKKTATLNSIDNYLDNILYFIQKKYLSKTSTVKWKTRNSTAKLIFDGNQLLIQVGKGDIVCFSKNDSSVIYNTEGIYNAYTQQWTGFNGKVTWERTGLKPSEVYAQLSRYQIDMKKSSFEADSVTLIYKRYFNEPLLGMLSEKVMADVDTQRAIYPQFKSYSKRHRIKNIFPNINYDGGFSLKGNRFIGEGTSEQMAILTIFRNDTLKLKVASRSYIFRENEINSQNASITIYIDKDSIYHPGLIFSFDAPKNLLSLIRNNEGTKISPYYDSYHRLELDFPYLSWKINEPQMLFKPIPKATNKKAIFTSMDYFSRSKYLELQGLDMKNPLQEIRSLSKKLNDRNFTEKEFADHIRMSLPQTRQILLNLAFKGFINYSLETGQVYVNDKTFFYLQCSVGQKDYDVINFESNVVGDDYNALLSLLDNNLKLKGVQEIFLSDSQNVAIFPKDQQIIIKKNRDFVFDGKVRAGLFLFVGSNFSFTYDQFKLTLTDINTIKMRVQTDELDKYGNKVQRDLTSIIENATGELLLDEPNNKSSVKRIPKYPIFNSKKDSYVFYDYQSVHNGVYKRDNFYFQIYPYSLDSINTLTKKNLLFKGHFVSAGIFPPFDDILSVQEDYSLGFKRNTPTDGFPTYGGKGNYKNQIYLSNRGLRGDGELVFVKAKALSDDFIFFPDSMNTTAKEFSIEKQSKGVEFASVQGKNIYIHWMPYKDEMLASNTNQPFDMYDKQATYTGTLKIEPKGLSGWGKLEFATAQLLSQDFNFKEHIVDADTSNFNLKTLDNSDFSFKTNNVKSHIDFNERKGEFQSNGEASFVEFPQNKYICYMDQFTWYMDKEEIEMSASKRALDKLPENKENLSPTEAEDVQLKGSQFISIHPNQDSLSFIAPNAKYNLRKYIITANEVKLIRVADATVYPGDGKVVVEKNAVMQTLKESKIIANNTNRYHTIYNATTNIYGKKSYSSSGYYDYVDETNNKQTIKFDIVSVDSTYQTYAKGKIGITENFTLSPNFAYTGDVYLQANNQFLTFEGSTKISHECETMNRYWVNFKATINPKEIFIPIGDSLRDINNNRLNSGFYVTNDSIHIYPAFLTKRKNYSDIAVFKATGFLTFDKKDSKYKISNKEKLQEFNLPGNYLSLHRSACNMYGEGKIDLGVNFGQLKQTTVGSINEDLIKGDIYIELIYALDFFIENKCMDIFTKDINNISGLEPVDLTRNAYIKGMYELVGEVKANELFSEYSLGKFKKMPKELEHTLVLNDLKLKWNPKTHSYISDTIIGVGSCGKEYINRMTKGYLEIIKKRSGDKFNLYLELSDNVWYYFSYSNNLMQVLSSNEDFNTIIKTLKPDQRKLEVEKGQAPYSYFLAAPTAMKKFKKHFQDLLENTDTNTDESEEAEEKNKNNE
ncbi:MAG: hypothetical protein HPY79_10560 [Bacteroidales bacterium]|nr:hypothetical protein [Bacteroidales bacterium]